MSSKSLNKVILIGNVTRDPDLRYTPQGNAVCTFGLATNRSWKTDSGELREEAEFHRLVAWNKLAELCSQLCTKGRKIYVEGRLQTRTFTGSDNAQHTITEIVIDDMILLDSRPGMGQTSGGFQPIPTGGQKPAVEPVAEPTAEPVAEEPKKTKSKSKKKDGAEKEEEKEIAEKAGEEEKPSGDEAKEPASANLPAGKAGATTGEDVNIDDIPF